MRVVGIVPVLEVKMVLVVGIVPIRVVGMLPDLVVGMIPDLANVGADTARIIIIVQDIDRTFFIVLLLVT